MSDAPLSLLAKLAQISRIDGALAQIGVDRKRLEASLKEQQQKLAQRDQERAIKQKLLADKKSKQQRDEQTLNSERQKLMDRRKALSSFSGQKIQQAAEREISTAAETLNNEEESLIKGLSDIEVAEKEFGTSESAVAELKAQLAKFEIEYKETLVNLEERQRLKEAQRTEMAAGIDRSAISTYNRVRERFPQNAVVAVKEKACSGCFMSLVAQTLVQVARGESIIKCPGCARILCLESHIEESKEE